MRISEIRLVNYIGIYNGLQLNEIYIDLTKCKTNKVFIVGDNGAGKSTLWGAMNILPDNNNKFIPNMPASKDITLIDNSTIYKIRFIHNVKQNGSRDTTKAYITKITQALSQELNPNGNVSGYYDVIRDELEMDVSLTDLSRLSSENRGLVDKTPSERKKTIVSKIDYLEMYNDIYKKMSKKSSTYKSLKNSIITKIQSIGSEDNLCLSLNSIENRLLELETKKNEIVNSIAENKSKISLLDPDNHIQEAYERIYKDLFNVDNNIKVLKYSINSVDIDEDFIFNRFNNNKIEIKNKTSQIETIKNGLSNKIREREEETNQLNKKNEKLSSLNTDSNYRDLQISISNYKKDIEEYESIIHNIGFCDIDNISKDEFILGLNTLKEIKEIIDTVRTNVEYSILDKSIQYILNDNYVDLLSINNKLDNYEADRYKYSLQIEHFKSLAKVEEKLILRPDGCKIDTCQFIKDAVLASKENPKKKMDELESLMSETIDNIQNTKKDIVMFNNINETINILKRVLRSIDNNKNILNKLPINNIFSSTKDILDKILNGYHFKEIDTIYNFIDYSNIIDDYKFKKNALYKLEVDYNIYISKTELVEEIMQDINNINNKLNNIISSILSDNDTITTLNEEIETLEKENINNETLLNTTKEINKLKKERSDIYNKYNEIKDDISRIKECKSNLSCLENELKEIQNLINPLTSEKDKLKHQIILLNDYKVQLATYNKKSEVVETIKYYSSPSKGIQTLYMQLYMGKTLSMANELLSMMFGGEYVLQKYIINENEFRIPCLGSGILNDDISSMSTSQKCMISMILSFVLLKQSSDKYNILEIDEIDGGLDTANRLQFSIVLDKLMVLLNTEQLISISHNSEMDLSNADIILLKYNKFDHDIINGNIIYNYNL